MAFNSLLKKYYNEVEHNYICSGSFQNGHHAIRQLYNIGWPWGGYKNVLPEMLTTSRKEPSNTFIIIYRVFCVILLCYEREWLPATIFLFTNSAYGPRACVVRSSSGNIQVTHYCPGNNVSEYAQIYVDNIIAVLVTKREEYTILFWPLKALNE